MKREELVALIKGVVDDKNVSEAVEERLVKMEEAMEKYGSLGHLIVPRKQEEDVEKGQLATRALKAIAGAHLSQKAGRIVSPADYAEKHFGEGAAIVKALASEDNEDGGFLLAPEISADIIELLRPASVVRQLNPNIIPMNSGTMLIPKITAGSSGSYIGENTNVPATQPTFGQIQAVARKLAALVPISNDLIRRADPGSETMIRDDLVAGLAQTSDLAFIRDDGTANAPKGLRYWAAAANVIDSADHGSPDLADMTTDLGALVLALVGSDVRMLRPGWIMSPRSWNALMTIRDGNGNFAFRDEMLAGTLWGWPFKFTSQIPENLDDSATAANNESEVYFSDFADVIIAEAMQLELAVSSEAAYHDGSNVVAAFSLDQTVMRAILEHDLVVRHAESVAVLIEVTWGL